MFGEQLEGMLLYGSAVRGEFLPGRSNLNILLLVPSYDSVVLKQYSALHRQWSKEQIVVPLFLTEEELRFSAAVFPLEFLEIQEQHRVLRRAGSVHRFSREDRSAERGRGPRPHESSVAPASTVCRRERRARRPRRFYCRFRSRQPSIAAWGATSSRASRPLSLRRHDQGRRRAVSPWTCRACWTSCCSSADRSLPGPTKSLVSLTGISKP